MNLRSQAIIEAVLIRLKERTKWASREATKIAKEKENLKKLCALASHARHVSKARRAGLRENNSVVQTVHKG